MGEVSDELAHTESEGHRMRVSNRCRLSVAGFRRVGVPARDPNSAATAQTTAHTLAGARRQRRRKRWGPDTEAIESRREEGLRQFRSRSKPHPGGGAERRRDCDRSRAVHCSATGREEGDGRKVQRDEEKRRGSGTGSQRQRKRESARHGRPIAR